MDWEERLQRKQKEEREMTVVDTCEFVSERLPSLTAYEVLKAMREHFTLFGTLEMEGDGCIRDVWFCKKVGFKRKDGYEGVMGYYFEEGNEWCANYVVLRVKTWLNEVELVLRHCSNEDTLRFLTEVLPRKMDEWWDEDQQLIREKDRRKHLSQLFKIRFEATMLRLTGEHGCVTDREDLYGVEVMMEGTDFKVGLYPDPSLPNAELFDELPTLLKAMKEICHAMEEFHCWTQFRWLQFAESSVDAEHLKITTRAFGDFDNQYLYARRRLERMLEPYLTMIKRYWVFVISNER